MGPVDDRIPPLSKGFNHRIKTYLHTYTFLCPRELGQCTRGGEWTQEVAVSFHYVDSRGWTQQVPLPDELYLTSPTTAFSLWVKPQRLRRSLGDVSLSTQACLLGAYPRSPWWRCPWYRHGPSHVLHSPGFMSMLHWVWRPP